ncbi:MAG: S41 family peptidase [Chloroflexi bacterium]|nr:S41 family peptidase [Chloroflexota bacterium]
MPIYLRRILMRVIIVFVLCLGIGVGIVFDHQVLAAQAQTPTPAGPDMQLIAEAWSKIDQHYVDKSAKQTKPLTYGAISGMVNALGDTGHSTFMTPEMVKAQHNFRQGAYEGIGAQLESKDGHPVIIAPFDNSPAQRAGLRAGHIILKVNGDVVTGLPLEQVISRVLGPAGTAVTLTILDPQTNQTMDLTIVRARITLNNVTWQQLPGTTLAHLRIAAFSQNTSRDLRAALTEIQQQGMTGIILDLRNNPGGLLSEATTTASQFLSSGDVLLEKDSQGQIRHIAVRPGGLATQVPLVVLVNRGSASASEIVSGALQDAQRATLIGETTFGTGTVLTEFGLSDGSALMLAIQEWLTPNGRVIWHKGIIPDKTVTLPVTARLLMPEGERNLTAEQLRASEDQQLLRAIETLIKSAQQDNPFPVPTDASTIEVSQLLALNLDYFQRFAFV